MTEETAVELTKEEIEAERERKARKTERREKFVSEQLFAYANKVPGHVRNLFYAREGQYGKGDELLVWSNRDRDKAMWIDPTENNMYGLVIYENKLDLLTHLMSLNTGMSYVVWKRTYTPRWEITQQEVAMVYDKGVK